MSNTFALAGTSRHLAAHPSKIRLNSMFELTVRPKKKRDYFSYGIIIYAVCFFITYKTLFQLAYIDDFSALWFWGYGLIIVHFLGLIWCTIACLLCLMPRHLASFICAASLVVGLEYLSPESLKLYFWLHKSDYLARVSATHPSHDGHHLSIVLYRYTVYRPSMPGGYLCSTEIVYDNSNDIGFIAETDDGRAFVVKVDGDFYFRYPPCG
jgi:hypothetical protein